MNNKTRTVPVGALLIDRFTGDTLVIEAETPIGTQKEWYAELYNIVNDKPLK